MSEYQYYEFQAVDRPLSKQEMDKLRSISSRATITPNRFMNVYNYGDFQGDPARVMETYFDALVFEVMRQLNLDTAFAFGSHFSRQGFRCIPWKRAFAEPFGTCWNGHCARPRSDTRSTATSPAIANTHNPRRNLAGAITLCRST